MPEEEYVWLPRDDILTVEQIGDIVDVFSELGVDKVRLTGGEPLLRREVADVVERLSANPDVRDLSMTTNGGDNVLLLDGIDVSHIRWSERPPPLVKRGGEEVELTAHRVTVGLRHPVCALGQLVQQRLELGSQRLELRARVGLDPLPIRILVVVAQGQLLS